MHDQVISTINVHYPAMPTVDCLFNEHHSVMTVRIGPVTVFFDNPVALHDWIRCLAHEAYKAEAKIEINRRIEV